MFSSKSKDTAAATHAAIPVTAQKRPMRSSSAPSIISSDLTVTGTLASTGDIQIDGKIEGDVQSTGLVIGDKAFIHGDVMAEDVTVRGRVQGSIRARKVLLAATCRVEGNILHEAFAVETGAFFEGNCRHSDNPMAEDAPKMSSFDKRPPGAAPNPVASIGRTDGAGRPSAATFAPLKSGA